MFLRKLLAAVFALSIISGCNDANNADTSSDYNVTIRTLDKFGQDATSFVQGEDITIVLSIKNVSTEKKTLTFPSGKQFDFIIKDVNHDIVWDWAIGKLFTRGFTSYDIAPNDTHTVTITFNQVLPIGNYTLEAVDIGINTIPKQSFSII